MQPAISCTTFPAFASRSEASSDPYDMLNTSSSNRGPRTGTETIQQAMELERRLKSVPMLVRTCKGFVGNRLMIAREEQAGRLLLEGASSPQVDRVLREFGLPMGAFELQDMAGGIELNFRHRQETGEENWLIDQLFARGRLGQKSGKGYYRYRTQFRIARWTI